METKYSAQFLRKRKFMLVLPLLALPFITLAFWSLGGGKGSGQDNTLSPTSSGLNLTLPEASFKTEKVPMDKLKFYELADKDSSRLQKLMKQDPYYSMAYTEDNNNTLQNLPQAGTSPFTPSFHDQPLPKSSSTGKNQKYNDPNEEKVMKKLQALTAAMEEQELPASKIVDPVPTRYQDNESGKLMAMINSLSVGENTNDPELDKLDKMLDKIIDIQNPNRPKELPLAPHSLNKNAVLSINTTAPEDEFTLLEAVYDDTIKTIPATEAPISFYGLSGEEQSGDIHSTSQINNSVKAVVHQDQSLVNGATIKLRLAQDLHIGSHTIATGQFIYGTVGLNNERLQVDIKSIRAGDDILPVKLRLFDIDGMEGIYIPGSIQRDVAKQSGGNAIQSIDLMNSLNSSLEMQAASVGIQTAKSLINKKVKLVKVQVKAGYQVLLQDQSTLK